MEVNPYAGKLAEPAMLVNVPKLVTAYYTEVPDPSVPEQRVAFGTDGHRGSAFYKAFKEWHILAISQTICLYRNQQKMMVLCFSAWTHMHSPCRLLPVPKPIRPGLFAGLENDGGGEENAFIEQEITI